MVRDDHATLQQAPKAIQVRRMDISTHILALRMAHLLIRMRLLEWRIAVVFISGEQRNPFAYRLSDEAQERSASARSMTWATTLPFRALPNDADPINCPRTLILTAFRGVTFLLFPPM